MSIRWKLLGVLLGLSVVNLALVLWLVLGLKEASMSGRLFHDFVNGKDLVADVLPPPGYILESWSLAQEMMFTDEETGLEGLHQQVLALEKVFWERNQFWDEILEDEGLREAMVIRARDPAARFFKVYHEAFWPAISGGDPEKAKEILRGPLHQSYLAQRQAVDTVVLRANRFNEKVAQSVDASQGALTGRTWIVSAALAFTTVAAFVAGWFLVKSIHSRLTNVCYHLDRVADGDLTSFERVFSSAGLLAGHGGVNGLPAGRMVSPVNGSSSPKAIPMQNIIPD